MFAFIYLYCLTIVCIMDTGRTEFRERQDYKTDMPMVIKRGDFFFPLKPCLKLIASPKVRGKPVVKVVNHFYKFLKRTFFKWIININMKQANLRIFCQNPTCKMIFKYINIKKCTKYLRIKKY